MEYAQGAVLFCFIVDVSSNLVHPVMSLPKFFRVALLALGLSYDCPSASEVTLKDTDKIN